MGATSPCPGLQCRRQLDQEVPMPGPHGGRRRQPHRSAGVSHSGSHPRWVTGLVWGWSGSRCRGWCHRGLKAAGSQRAPSTEAELLTKPNRAKHLCPGVRRTQRETGAHLYSVACPLIGVAVPSRLHSGHSEVARSSHGQLVPGWLRVGGVLICR